MVTDQNNPDGRAKDCADIPLKEGEIVVQGVKELCFVAQNNHRCMGHNYPEDDWQIVAIASTFEELERLAAEEIVKTNISIDSCNLFEIVTIHYGGKRYLNVDLDNCGDVEDCLDKSILCVYREKEVDAFRRKVLNSEYYAQLKAAAQEEAKRKEEERMAREKKRQEEKERETLAKLKKKYEE